MLDETLGFRVIKLNKLKSIEYPNSKITFEVTELPLLRELEILNCSMCRYTYNVASDCPLMSTSLSTLLNLLILNSVLHSSTLPSNTIAWVASSTAMKSAIQYNFHIL